MGGTSGGQVAQELESIILLRWKELCIWRHQTREERIWVTLYYQTLPARGAELVAHLAWEWVQCAPSLSSLTSGQLKG